MSMLGGQPNLSSITNLLKTPGLDKLLGGILKKPFTLLAPTNDALSSLVENVNQLAALLKNHIIPGKQDAASIAGGALKNASGSAVDVVGSALGQLMSSEKFNVIPVNKVLQ